MPWTLIKNLFITFMLTLVTLGCGTLDSQPKKQGSFEPVYEFVNADYENAWRAAQIAMSKYPIAINNIDAGILQTQSIPRYEIWKPSHIQVKKNQGGQAYKLKLNMLKGVFNGRPATKITIKKEIQRRRDFFASKEEIASDQLEEKLLMYRIKRELIMEKKIERIAEKLQ